MKNQPKASLPSHLISWFSHSLMFLPVLLLILLLLFPALSIQGACSGILLWFQVVLPTLAPFMICTQMITALGGAELLMAPLSPVFGSLFHLTLSGSYILLCGLLCGYPLGAKMCADFQKRGAIRPKEAAYLLAIANHPSPMFLLGYVRAALPLPVSPVLLLTCLYLPVLPLSLAARHLYGIDAVSKSRFFSRPWLGASSLAPPDPHTEGPVKKMSLEEAIGSTCHTMVLIGGYIMLFSILATWIQALPMLSPILRAVLTGMAEITTGIHSLCTSLSPENALLPVIAATAFGGLSGIFQTRSVIRDSGLSIGPYIGWKIAHACLSCLTGALLLSLP